MSKQPFIELNVVGGDTMFVNKDHIVGIYLGSNACFIKLTNSNAPIQIRESYDQLKTMLRD